MITEIEKFVDSIAKRIYPLTDKEKNCINEFGKMVIKRGHVKKAILEVINEKVNEQGSEARTEETKIQETPY
jgi:hypothetical protein